MSSEPSDNDQLVRWDKRVARWRSQVHSRSVRLLILQIIVNHRMCVDIFFLLSHSDNGTRVRLTLRALRQIRKYDSTGSLFLDRNFKYKKKHLPALPFVGSDLVWGFSHNNQQSRATLSWVHKIRMSGRRGEEIAEPFSR